MWKLVLREKPVSIATMTRTLAILLWATVCVGVVASNETVVIAELIDPADGFLIETTPLPLHDLDDWKDWETWQAPAEIVKLAPFYKAGFDFDGLPVYIMEYGKWDYRRISCLSEDDVVIFLKYYEKITRHVVKDGLANSNQGVVFIYDWDGFNLKNFASRKSLKLALRNFIAVVRLYHVLVYGFEINSESLKIAAALLARASSVYTASVERVGKFCLIYNSKTANYAAETFTDIARPFLGNLLEKLEIHGTRSEKWKPALFRKIPQDQLPPQYGGYNKDWKPLPLV